MVRYPRENLSESIFLWPWISLKYTTIVLIRQLLSVIETVDIHGSLVICGVSALVIALLITLWQIYPRSSIYDIIEVFFFRYQLSSSKSFTHILHWETWNLVW
jgi:hypothetical protein